MSRVAGIILAAGGSSRMGGPKQLARLDGQSLVRRTARSVLASRCAGAFVVLGAYASEVAADLRGVPVTLVQSPHWQEGLAHSIRAGIAAVDDAGFDAALLALVDQPAVSAALLDRLIAALAGAPAGIVACEYAGTLGPPTLWARSHFGALRALSGDRGAKPLLLAHEAGVVRIPFPDGALDVDTPADLERARSRLPT